MSLWFTWVFMKLWQGNLQEYKTLSTTSPSTRRELSKHLKMNEWTQGWKVFLQKILFFLFIFPVLIEQRCHTIGSSVCTAWSPDVMRTRQHKPLQGHGFCQPISPGCWRTWGGGRRGVRFCVISWEAPCQRGGGEHVFKVPSLLYYLLSSSER